MHSDGLIENAYSIEKELISKKMVRQGRPFPHTIGVLASTSWDKKLEIPIPCPNATAAICGTMVNSLYHGHKWPTFCATLANILYSSHSEVSIQNVECIGYAK